MTQEEKELLLKDLCARFPYGVKVHTWYNSPVDIECVGIDLYTCVINLNIPNDDNAKVYVDNCKPYLRPMSSMTEDEMVSYLDTITGDDKSKLDEVVNLVDWLNRHHFDYCGLIEKGLALEAPEGMYKFD